MLKATKSSRTILMNSCRQKHSQDIIDRDMLINIVSTTLHQIFCTIFFNSEVIFKSIIDPDDNLKLLPMWNMHDLSSICDTKQNQ